MKISKIILTVSLVVIFATIPWRSVYAEATNHSGRFSLPLEKSDSITLYTENDQRYVALTVCNDKSSSVPVQILVDGRAVLAVAASNCGTLLANAVTVSMDVLVPGTATGTYSVMVLAEFKSV
jgi:hypothetical protein